MHPIIKQEVQLTRRHFFSRLGIGSAALASLLNEDSLANPHSAIPAPQSPASHFSPKAKRVIYLFQSGGPLDLFDPTPTLQKYRGQNLPESIRQGQRLTGMTAYQSSFPTTRHFSILRSTDNPARDTDQPTAALPQDLRERGMLDDTLMIWGGKFGRTVYSQGKLTETDYGRDHHPRCYPVWRAGGGIKGEQTIGETDEFIYNIARDPVSVFDLNATLLHSLGLDHTRLTYKYQGHYFRLSDLYQSAAPIKNTKA